ncbi:MAG: DNA primase [Bacteroidaceae bacterium]|nr:DNA primase [Bacteroidaceae bacterium]
MIDDATKNRILDTAQILEVVSDFVTLRRRGANYIGLCPFHNERTPSFNVNPARGIFKCFGCGKSGDAARFLMEHEQMTFPEALRWLGKKYGIPIEERELTDEERQEQSQRESVGIINEYARKWFEDQLWNTDDGRAVGLAYFRSRGFRDDIIHKFQLGYCPEGQDTMVQDAVRQGYKKELLVEAGVAYALEEGRLRDRFHGRVMFPIHSLSGKVIAFSGRIMKSDAKVAKYVNSPESPVYTKSNELYGIWLAKSAIVKQDKCFLVEGNTDVVSLHQAGIENVVASCGTSLTTGQIRKIHRFTSNITILYDGDSAGIHASLRGIDMLLEEGMNVKVVLLPDGEDPDSFARAHNADELRQYIEAHEVDFIRFKTNLLLADVGDDPFKRAALIKDIVTSISKIPEQIVRSTYITACSQMLRTDERIIISEVDKLRKDAREKAKKDALNAEQRATTIAEASSETIDETGEGKSNTIVEPEPANQSIPNNQTTPNAPLSPSNTDPLQQKELLLMQQLVRHGEEIICYDEDEAGNVVPISVADFLLGDLEADGLTFSDPLLRQMADEILQHLHEPGFVASRYFLRHNDSRISALATELIGERYELSRLFSADTSLQEVVPHLINDYKLAIVERRLKEIISRLKDPAVAGSPELSREVMEEYSDLINARKTLAKQLGERVTGG